MKNFHLQKVLNEEDKVPFKLPADKIFDPKSLDLKGMAASTKRDADIRAEEERRQREFAKNKEKYVELITRAQDAGDTDNQLETLFAELVPSRGSADTVAGELVRAMMRILYRDANDGDLFYEGYGIETCGSSVAYLIDNINELFEKFEKIAHRQLEDDDYTNALENITQDILNYIYTNDSVWQVNEDDSRSGDWERVYESNYQEDWQPEYDYDFSIPDAIKAHIEAGNITGNEFKEVVESSLDSSNFKYSSVEVWGDTIYIYGLDRDGYDELERERWWDDSSWDSYLEELEDEYGDPYEEDDDDDIDESLESPKFKKGDKVKYNGKVTTIVDVETDPEFGVDYLIVNPDYDGTDARYENIWVADKVDPV